MSTRQILLLTFILGSIMSMKNLNPTKDKTENPKHLISDLQKTDVDMEDLKDKFYDYIETMPIANFSRKENVGDLLKDLYQFEIVKSVQIQSELESAVENKSIDGIFDPEIDGVIEAGDRNAFQGFLVKLRKTLLNSIVRFQYVNLDNHKKLNQDIAEEMQKIATAENISSSEAKKKVLGMEIYKEKLKALQLSPIMRYLINKIKIKSRVYSISKDTNKIVLTLQDNIDKTQEKLNTYRTNIKNYNALREEPVTNLKNVILHYISTVAEPEFPIDNSNLDLMKKRVKDLGDAFNIVSVTKKSDDFVVDVLNMVRALLDINTEDNDKNDWKLVSARYLLQLIISKGYAKEDFNDYFREMNGNVTKSDDNEPIINDNDVIKIDEKSSSEEEVVPRNQKGSKQSTESEMEIVENDGKNIVNVVVGEVDDNLRAHLEKSTDLRAYASEVVMEEETEDAIIQTVYVYVQRASSPCFDEDL